MPTCSPHLRFISLFVIAACTVTMMTDLWRFDRVRSQARGVPAGKSPTRPSRTPDDQRTRVSPPARPPRGRQHAIRHAALFGATP
jgi:hypothetical protein